MSLLKSIFLLIFLHIIFFTNAVSYEELFKGYLKNDLNAQKLQLELDSARNNLQLFYYQNLVDFTLGANGTFTFSEDEVALDFTPELSLKLPEWRNTSFSFKLPTNIPITGNDISETSYVPDVYVYAQTDIFPFKRNITAKYVQQISLKRSILEKERLAEQQNLVTRISFLTLLKEAFQAKYNIDEAQVDHNDAIRDLKLAKLQGYDESSLEYKRLNLVVSKKLRLIEEQKRTYQQKLQRLAMECGIEIDELPSDIPEEKLPDVKSFTLERYKDYENAVYTKYKNDLSRQASKNEKNFQLAGGVGYEAKTNNSRNDYTTTSKSHYIEPGLSASYNGFSADVGVNIPISENSRPELTFSMNWSVLTIAQTHLENKIMALEEKGDRLDIEQIIKDYKTKFDELLLKKETLEWQRDTYKTEEEIYLQQVQEYRKRYDAGYISKSEYDRGEIEYQSAVTQNLLGRIERLIFISETANLFLPYINTAKGE